MQPRPEPTGEDDRKVGGLQNLVRNSWGTITAAIYPKIIILKLKPPFFIFIFFQLQVTFNIILY